MLSRKGTYQILEGTGKPKSWLHHSRSSSFFASAVLARHIYREVAAETQFDSLRTPRLPRWGYSTRNTDTIRTGPRHWPANTSNSAFQKDTLLTSIEWPPSNRPRKKGQAIKFYSYVSNAALWNVSAPVEPVVCTWYLVERNWSSIKNNLSVVVVKTYIISIMNTIYRNLSIPMRYLVLTRNPIFQKGLYHTVNRVGFIFSIFG